ncbi:unnamed protein product [Penicillium bialowiezense]
MANKKTIKLAHEDTSKATLKAAAGTTKPKRAEALGATTRSISKPGAASPRKHRSGRQTGGPSPPPKRIVTENQTYDFEEDGLPECLKRKPVAGCFVDFIYLKDPDTVNHVIFTSRYFAAPPAKAGGTAPPAPAPVPDPVMPASFWGAANFKRIEIPGIPFGPLAKAIETEGLAERENGDVLSISS